MSNKINVITPKSINNKSFLFSIIVPVYNTEKYVEKCLNSIQKAMDTDCEVIIVNDGATDNSDSIIKEYINKLPDKYKENFVYVTKENKGLADTKNVGISFARGKFISVVDSELSIMKKIIIKGTSINIIVKVLIRLIVIGLELSRVE